MASSSLPNEIRAAIVRVAAYMGALALLASAAAALNNVRRVSIAIPPL